MSFLTKVGNLDYNYSVNVKVRGMILHGTAGIIQAESSKTKKQHGIYSRKRLCVC